MKVGLFVTVVALICVALGVQIFYARAYAASATLAVKIVWGVNIGLLVALLIGLVAYLSTAGVG